MMASLFDLDDSSDSENDVDYVPEAAGYSSDEEDPNAHVSDDEEETETNPKKKSKSRVSKAAKNVTETKESVPEDSKPVSSVDEKKKADDLFKSFLEEAAADMKEKNECASSGISCCGSATSSPLVTASDKSSFSSPSSVKSSDNLFEFAGETVVVPKDTDKSVNVDSPVAPEKEIEKKPSAAAPPVTPVKKRGLDSVLGLIQNKKQKLSVLQKTQLDWKSFKKDEGLEEDLEQYNRGKGGFIERQRFLQRSDVRSYEIERDMRMSKKRDK